MLVAIATDAHRVSMHFGRCEVYTLVELDDGHVQKKEVISNPGHAPNALPAYLKEQGVDVVVCGGIGHRAQELFSQFGIEVVAGVDAEIAEVVQQLAEGQLRGGDSLCQPGDGRGYGLDKTVCDHDEHT